MSKNGESTFKIVIATDNHLGCYSNDAIRSDDSFATFEEVLKQSVAEQADFLLLGGDLFHHNRPSQPTVHRCLRLLKKYCLGSREVGFEVVSDQSFNFAEKRANFEDPNLKISLPIFSIHGNHDDPTGIENLSVMDIMSTANFVNYFGKAVDISKINIKPVLMRKGRTKLAVYGLGSIKDERLHRLFLDRKVKFSRPAEDKEDWFNIFVIHQNRYKHSFNRLNYIPENFIPSFIDLVVWAHEHESIMQLNQNNDFYVVQPGSTTRTSLSKNELTEKHIGVLTIERQTCRLKPIKLNSVRPFDLEEIELSKIFETEIGLDKTEQIDHFAIEKKLNQKIDEMIENVATKLDLTEEELSQKSNLPLIRLRVEYSGFEVLNVPRFGQKYVGRVANPHDLLLFYRKTKARRANKRNLSEADSERDLGAIPNLILDQIKKNNANPSLLDENDFIGALQKFVEKSEYGAIDEFVEKSVNFAREKLSESNEVTSQSRELIQEKMKQIRIGKQSKRKVEKDVDNRLKNASNINTKNGDNSQKRTFLADNIDKNKLKNNEIDKFFQKVRNGLSGPSDDRKRKNSRSLRSQQKKSK